MEHEPKSEVASAAVSGKDGGEDWFIDLLDAAKRELTQREYRIGQLERQLELAHSELERAHDRSSRMESQAGGQEEQIASLSIRLEEMAEQLMQVEADLSQAERAVRASEKLEQFHVNEIQRVESENATHALTNDEQARRIRALDQIIDGYVASNARIRSDFDKLRLMMRRPTGLAG